MKFRTFGIGCVGLVIGLLFLIVFLSRGLSAVYLSKPDVDVDPVRIVVESGEGLSSIALKLDDAGLLEARSWFSWYGRLSGKASEIQAGEFFVYPGMNVVDLYDVLKNGTSVERRITFIEGWTLREVSEALVNDGVAQDGEVERIVADKGFRSRYSFLSVIPEGLDIEGFVYPDTYSFFEDVTAREVLEKTLDTFESRVVDGREELILSSDYDLFEIVTIASILEREVCGYENKRVVAGIINNRLDIGMALQMDSTVNYVTGENRPGILLSQRDIESPDFKS